MSKKNLLICIVFIVLLFSIFYLLKAYLIRKNDSIGFYLNNNKTDTMEINNDVMFHKAICDNDVTVNWDNSSKKLLISNLEQKSKCNLYFIKSTYDFDYTGSEEIFTAPITGTYKLETWGAQGLSNLNVSPIAVGGYGGYASGFVSLKANDIIYINVGEGGKNSMNAYNGGGYGQLSGGGATHIATITGLLSSLENNNDKILIVAGGGGGNDTSKDIIPSGGGFVGVNGSNAIGGKQNMQTDSQYNAAFGKGGDSFVYNNGDSGGGGGAGFYGGAGSPDWWSSGAGGSGYIGNSLLTQKSMYCYNCEESSEESTKTISTSCTSVTPTENCAKQGNGYARITLISIDE